MVRTRSRRLALAASICTLALLAPAVTAEAHPGHPGPPVGPKPVATAGAAGAGDPYFPLSGNGGFHVVHYGISIDYSPATSVLSGVATIAARATQSLSRFDLDLSGFTVASVKVDGRTAKFARAGQELQITPTHALPRGHRFSVQVRYSGVPAFATDPDGSPDGWIKTDNGVFVASEPQGAMTWFPANSHPLDKSAFDVVVTVPKGYTAVGNGELVAQRTVKGRTTFHWRERAPMAAYLATASIGKFDVTTYKANGLPVYVAVDPREAAASAASLKKLPEILKYEAGIFGRYPFSSTGAIIMHAPDVGYALETQTRPIFDSAIDDDVLVHELAHQWFGDSVSITKWQDIWLNEGFATYAEWLWFEHTGDETAQQQFDDLYARPATSSLWARPVADPGSGENIFASPVYNRGAMVLHKLRQAVGDATFFKILRTWATAHRYGHGTTAQFTELATRLSHKNLTSLFQTWLYTAGKPSHA